MTAPTNNDIPSNSVQDRMYNAEKFDEFMNSDNPNYTDRKGKSRWTVSGIRQAIQNWMDSLNASSGASSIGLSNGGKVQDLQNFLSFDMFGIDSTGQTDVTAQIVSVFDKANALGIKVVQRKGIYRISGSTIITSTSGFDLGGATFRPDSNFTGYLLGTQTKPSTTHTQSSPLITLINSGTLNKGDGVLTGLSSDSTLNGEAIFLTGADPLYIARGTTKYWFHSTRISNRGKMDDHLKYGVSAVTGLVELPIEDKITEFNLPCFDMTNAPANNGLIRFNYISRARVSGGSIINRPINDIDKDPVIISLNYCYDIEVSDLYDEFPSYPLVNGTIAYAYTLNFNYCNRLRFTNCNSQGSGWGVTGGQLSSNIIYNFCSLNRIDMHDPFMGYLKVIDCDLGYWGTSVFGMGDMYLERVTVKLEDSAYNGYREVTGIFNTRPDFGGIFDGNIYLKDVTIIGDAKVYRTINGQGVPLFSAYSFNATTGNIPDGSPVERWGYKEIVVDGLYCKDPVIGRRFDAIIKASSIQYTTCFPLKIKICNARFNATQPELFDLHGWKNPIYNSGPSSIYSTLTFRPTNYIELDDVSCAGLEIQRPYSSYDFHNLDVRITNMRNIENVSTPAVPFYTDQVGKYTFNNCYISFLSDSTLSTSNASTRYSTFAINGGIFDSGAAVPFSMTYANGYSTPVLCNSVIFIGDYSQTAVTASNNNLAEFASVQNCRYFNKTSQSYVNPALWLGAAGPGGTSTSFNLARGNDLTLGITVTGSSASGTAAVSIKVPGMSVAGHLGGNVYSDTAAASATYQLYLNARGGKANVGKVMSSGSLTGIYLQ